MCHRPRPWLFGLQKPFKLGYKFQICNRIYPPTLIANILERWQAQSLPPPGATSSIQERPLAQTDSAISQPQTTSLNIVVGGSVVSATVVPDGNVGVLAVLVPAPPEPHLEIVVLDLQLEQVVEQVVALVLVDAEDTLGEAFVDEDGWVGMSVWERMGRMRTTNT